MAKPIPRAAPVTKDQAVRRALKQRLDYRTYLWQFYLQDQIGIYRLELVHWLGWRAQSQPQTSSREHEPS